MINEFNDINFYKLLLILKDSNTKYLFNNTYYPLKKNLGKNLTLIFNAKTV